MSEQMDFEDGKYTVIYDEGHFKALRYGQPWRDLTGDNLVYAMLEKASQLKEERDALAAKLKELDGQEPVAWVGHGPRDGRVEFSISKPVPSVFRDFGFKPLFARPVPAEPVNARLVEVLHSIRQYGLDTLSGRADGGDDDYAWQRAAVNEMTKRARIALARAAEAQQAEPVRLTRESVARAIWGVRREYEDRCDMELEDMGESHPVWDEADAVLAAAELTQTDPTWLTIEQARNAERYAYLRSQHEGSVAASFAVFAPEQPIGEFGPVGSMPGELDAAIDSAMRADSHKVEG